MLLLIYGQQLRFWHVVIRLNQEGKAKENKEKKWMAPEVFPRIYSLNQQVACGLKERCGQGHQDECMQSDAMVAKRSAQQAPEMVAILYVDEDRALVDTSLGDVQWRTRQFKSRESQHGCCR